MTDLALSGLCPPRFAAVQRAFEANFARDEELGARFCLAIDGEVVVDLMGGFADRARTRPFEAATLAPVYSTTKAIAALLIARLASAGALGYDQPVAEFWPEFGQAGKSAVTVGEAMSHQAGLAGFVEPMDPSLWLDWDAICARLAAMTPLWPPGTASGYHPITFGYIAGEIFRRVDGRTMGRALREDLAEPFGLDLWIGLPDPEHERCAEMLKPRTLMALGPPSDIKRAAFLTPWASPEARSGAEWRRAEIPSANGHATAHGLARLAAVLACDGRLDGVEVLAPGIAAQASAERIRGPDLVLPFELSWAAGLMRNVPNWVYGPGHESFGHSGWGGSCVFADPERRVSGAYVMNRQSAHLIGDPRVRRLIDTAYEGL